MHHSSLSTSLTQLTSGSISLNLPLCSAHCIFRLSVLLPSTEPNVKVLTSLTVTAKREMETPGVPATYTVKLYSRTGSARVVGVKDRGTQNDIKSYILFKGGERSNDWYWFFNDSDLNDVVNKAKELDPNTEIFIVLMDDKKAIIDAGEFAVLIYVTGTVYKLCATQNSEQKEELEAYIELNIKGHKEEDWYRVEKVSQVQQIIDYANTPKINGVTYDVVRP